MADELLTPYVTLAEADAYNTGNALWNAATDPQQNNALYYGRLYIDKHYVFVEPIDENDVDEPVKQANSLLAAYYIESPTTFFDKESSYGVREKHVKADVVEVKTVYESAQNGGSSDKYPDITAILAQYATYKGESGTIGITR